MMKYDFDDILIKPSVITDINSRTQIDVLDLEDMLPIFTAPMDTVVDERSASYFVKQGIRVIQPRKQDVDSSYISTNMSFWLSYGLREFRDVFLINTPDNRGATMYALIDIANGHMPALQIALVEAKEKYGDQLVIMVGNIANPETYELLSNSGADYIRVGIGNGGGCLTTQQTGVGYPMASLIAESFEISKRLSKPAKIVADGGFKKYADVIKALALGADYVMLGSILNKALESAGETTNDKDEVIDQYSDIAKNYLDVDIPLYKTFRGMSTKEVQLDWGKVEIKTSEGVVRKHKVEYTVSGWVDNFTHYLKSAMSYTNATTLELFKGKVDYMIISENAFHRYNK